MITVCWVHAGHCQLQRQCEQVLIGLASALQGSVKVSSQLAMTWAVMHTSSTALGWALEPPASGPVLAHAAGVMDRAGEAMCTTVELVDQAR